MPVRVVFFDAAGTLIRLRIGVGETYSACARRHGVYADPAHLEGAFRRAFQSAPPLAFPGVAPESLDRSERLWWAAIVRQVFHEQRFDDFDRFFRDLYDGLARPEAWEVYPDVLVTLAELRRRRLGIGIISNFDSRLTGILAGLGLAPFLDSITYSSEAGAAKPDRRIFQIALARQGALPVDALHVGDNEREDVAGARDAGLSALRVEAGIGAVLAHL